MGYTTNFSGKFSFNRPLTTTEKNYIKKFSETRRMKRDVSKLYEKHKGKYGLPLLLTITPEMEEHINFFKELGIEVSLTPTIDTRTPEEIYGNEGEYFIGGTGSFGQDKDETVIDSNEAPGSVTMLPDEDFSTYWKRKSQAIINGECQPGLWCQWTVNSKGTELEWDGGEKFYNYVEWLQYLINHFFSKWGVVLNGVVKWAGEDAEDVGKIIVVDNVIDAHRFE